MLLGEVNEVNFKTSKVATFLFCLFMFLVVILLANVLIAIVTDSYKVIQYERAAIVFWTNRLDFVAEMDAIANGPWKKRLKSCCGMGKDDDDKGAATKGSTFGKEFWKRLMDLFDDDIEENYMTAEFFAYLLLRACTAMFIIPFWILLGLFTAGYLWPPQVREAIFTSAVRKHSSESAEEDELRKTQVENLQKEVEKLREDLTQELAGDRTQVVQMKTQIDHRRTEIDNELKNIKRIVTMLFEQQQL
jgi:flagellar basal body-associated protein FliL